MQPQVEISSTKNINVLLWAIRIRKLSKSNKRKAARKIVRNILCDLQLSVMKMNKKH